MKRTLLGAVLVLLALTAADCNGRADRHTPQPEPSVHTADQEAPVVEGAECHQYSMRRLDNEGGFLVCRTGADERLRWQKE